MLPTVTEMFLASLAGLVIAMIGSLLSSKYKKTALTVEVSSSLLVLAFLFYHFGLDGFIYMSLAASSYLIIPTLTGRRSKAFEIKEELKNVDVEEIQLKRDRKRLLEEMSITLVVLSGSLLFLVFGPDNSVLKFIIFIGILTVLPELLKRLFIIKTVQSFYSKSDKMLIILSRYESRKYPLHQMQHISIGSTGDLLKLHPLLTLFSSIADFTTSARETLHLRFPGEETYLTVEYPEYWHLLFEKEQSNVENALEENEKYEKILPFYHKNNLKRLAGKLYFAVTVKGISAYTTLFLLLYYFETPIWVTVAATVSFWTFNLYISDRILAIAMDAKEISDSEILKAASAVFQRAGLPKVKVFETDSTEYNGLATGMTIGRSMVTLTTASMKLPIETIEGIIAHEAIHVKKRDILWGQFYRLLYLGLLVAVVFGIQHYVTNIEAYTIPIFLLFWFLIIFFSIYQSFCSQWMEVRADHLGATLLEEKQEQMANSLTEIATCHDKEVNQAFQYQSLNKESNHSISTVERGKWYWRLLEFHFMPHPPMYWRISTLQLYTYGWSPKLIQRWVIDRMLEPIRK